MFTEKSFVSDPLKINYAEGPASGGAMLLLHGGSASWKSCLPIMPELAKRWHIYAPDLRGHGKSSHMPGHYALTDYVSDAVLFLEQVVGEPAVLFGHSLGGQVAFLVAAYHPVLVRALIIGDSPLDKASLKVQLQHTFPRLKHWRNLAGKELPLEELIEGVKNTPVEAVGEGEPVAARTLFGEDNPWYREMALNLQQIDPTMLDQVIEFDRMHAVLDYQNLLPLVKCPILLIQGNPTLGGMLTDGVLEQVRTLVPQISIARLDEVGHNLYTGQDEPVLKPINTFLENLNSRI